MTTVAAAAKASPARTAGAARRLVKLDEVPSLDRETVLGWHREHLNGALVTLMQLGGYDAVRIVRASGPYVYTDDGRRLLDLVSSYGALNHGHNHPRVVAAARWFDGREPADLLKEFASPFPAALARNLVALAPAGLGSVFFCNSGTEAVEGALKLAQRSFGGERDRFVYAEGSLHGKTAGSLSVTGREKYRAHVRRFEDWPMVPFGDAAALARAFAGDREKRIAGAILEPIQGEAGVVVPPAATSPRRRGSRAPTGRSSSWTRSRRRSAARARSSAARRRASPPTSSASPSRSAAASRPSGDDRPPGDPAARLRADQRVPRPHLDLRRAGAGVRGRIARW